MVKTTVIDDSFVIHLTVSQAGQTSTVIAAFVSEEISVENIGESILLIDTISDVVAVAEVDEMVISPDILEDGVAPDVVSVSESVC